MSMKKFDIEKNIGMKVVGQMRSTGVPGRFAQGANAALDKREQRKRDSALGLVPFACKLPGELSKRLHDRAAAHEGGLNALTAELLAEALAPSGSTADKSPAPEAAVVQAEGAPAKKAPAKKKTAQP